MTNSPDPRKWRQLARSRHLNLVMDYDADRPELFRIYDRAGNLLLASSSLSAVFKAFPGISPEKHNGRIVFVF